MSSLGGIPGAPAAGQSLVSSQMGSVSFGEDEGVNPMENITNMVDAMLVLAVGLMMALVTLLNVNLLDIQELMQDELVQIEDAEEIVEDIQMTENPYIEMGKVYVDPTTGKQYLLEDTGDDDESEETTSD